MRIGKNTLLKYLYIFSFCLAISTNFVYFSIPYYVKYVHCVLWIIVGSHYAKYRQKDSNLYGFAECRKDMKKFFFSPYVLFLILSIFGFVYYYEQLKLNMITRCISNILQFGLMILSVVYTSKLFEDKLLDYTFKSIVLNYLIIIILTISKYGIIDFVQTGLMPWGELADTWLANASHSLEVHDVVFATGFFLIYYLSEFKEKRTWEKIFLSLVIIYLGYKRIQLAALLLIVLIFKVIKAKSKKTEMFWAFISMCAMLVASLIFVYLIKSGMLVILALKYGIKFNGRLESYMYMADYYTFSPIYIGRGLGAGTRILEAISNSSSNNIVSGHSDILYSYINYGFVGFIAWILYSYYMIPKKLAKKYNVKAVYLWIMFTIYAFITYFTDNTLMYFAFQTSYMIVVLQVLYENSKIIEDARKK